MIIVAFEDKTKKRHKIAEVESIPEAITAINQFLIDHNYQPPYWRLWEENGEKVVVFGVDNHQ